jgi:radical SAM superfamily enzyme YgiQ (UPF0313 family)
MRICLLTCSAPFLIDEKVFPPLGLMAVGTALKRQGHEVVFDNRDGCKYFALGPTTPEYPDALHKLFWIKQNEDARVIIGGPHAEANSLECLDDGFDVVTVGDGEKITAEEFIVADGIVDLSRKPLDSYPIIDRSLLDIHSYKYLINGLEATTTLTSRGCPYKCGFCAKTDDKMRYRSPDHVEQEVIYLKERFGYKALMLFDDTFITNKIRAIRICDVLREHGITWRCFVRGDLVVQHGLDLVRTMSRAGCVEVGVGIESGSDRILKIINKGEDTEVLRTAIGMLRGVGIRVKGFFIIGLPGENRESLEETWKFLHEVPLDDADFTVYQPYRGSPIWRDRELYDIGWDLAVEGDRWYKGRPGEYKTSVYTSSLSSEEIVEARGTLERWWGRVRNADSNWK